MTVQDGTPVFYETRQAGRPSDVGMFWEADPDELARLLHDSEADRALRLERIEEIWAERDGWIAKYNELDAIRSVMSRERDALAREREGLNQAVVHARDLRARDQFLFGQERAAAAKQRDALATEREGMLRGLDRLTQDKEQRDTAYDALLADRDALLADRDAVVAHRDALEADRNTLVAERDIVVARAREAEARPGGGRRHRWWFVPTSLKKLMARIAGR